MNFQILLLSSLIALTNCENFTETCYDIKQFKGLDNLRRLYRLATAKTDQLIQLNGYPVEIHKVSTDDGYTINMYRIPHGLANEHRDAIASVLLLSGFGSSSAAYAVMANGIAYALANEGYDVWLGNFRNSFQDTHHIKYSQSNSKFWDFGLDEMALSDTPAMIDHILLATKQTQVAIISISLSTATTTSMLAFRPEMAKKVSKHVALAPVVHLEYQTAPIPYHLLKEAYDITGFTDKIFSTFNKLAFYLTPFVCTPFTFMPICQTIQILYSGKSPGNYGNCIAVVATHAFRGGSIRTLIHFYQMITKQQFMQFDYGSGQNLQRYRMEMPPIVDVSQITTPTCLIYSANDPLASPLNVALLARQMKTAKVVLLEDIMINHLDYIIGALDDNIIKRVNRVILENISSP